MRNLFLTAAAGLLLLTTACSSDREEFKVTFTVNQAILRDSNQSYKDYVILVPHATFMDSVRAAAGTLQFTPEEVRGFFIEYAGIEAVTPDTGLWLVRKSFFEIWPENSEFFRIAFHEKMPGGSGETGTPNFYPEALVDSVVLNLNHLDLKFPVFSDSADFIIRTGVNNPIATAGLSGDSLFYQYRFVFGCYIQR
jgi:hypothetical protein